MINEFTCVGDTEYCTGPDHTSVAYIRLTEKNYEYSTYKTTNDLAEGLIYFNIPGTHINFLNHPFASTNYQISIWVFGEDKLSNPVLTFRL